MGHRVKLMPAKFVKASNIRNKNDVVNINQLSPSSTSCQAAVLIGIRHKSWPAPFLYDLIGSGRFEIQKPARANGLICRRQCVEGCLNDVSGFVKDRSPSRQWGKGAVVSGVTPAQAVEAPRASAW